MRKEKEKKYQYVLLYKFKDTQDMCLSIPAKTQKAAYDWYNSINRRALSEAEYFCFYKYERFFLLDEEEKVKEKKCEQNRKRTCSKND